MNSLTFWGRAGVWARARTQAHFAPIPTFPQRGKEKDI